MSVRAAPEARPARRFLLEVHRFRGVAIVAVILGHLLPRAFSGDDSLAVDLALRLTRNGTVWFVFIAGLLFQQGAAARFRYGSFLQQRATRLLVPYACWSLLTFLWAALELRSLPTWAEQRWDGAPDFARVLLYLGTGAHMGHLWYVPLGCLLALGSPLWLRLSRSRGFVLILLATIVVSLLVPRLPLRLEHWSVARRLAHFTSIYLLGMWVALHWDRVFQLAREWWPELLLLGCLAMISQAMQLPGTIRYSYLSKLLLIGPILVALERLNAMTNPLTRALDWLAEHSFTLYFAHYPIVLMVTGNFFDVRPDALTWAMAIGGIAAALCGSRVLEGFGGNRAPVAAGAKKQPAEQVKASGALR